MTEDGKQAGAPVSFNGAHPDVAMRSLPEEANASSSGTNSRKSNRAAAELRE